MTELAEPNIVSVASASLFKTTNDKGGKGAGEEKSLKGKCLNCGEPGHPFYQCPNKKKDGANPGTPATTTTPTPTQSSGDKNKTAKVNFTQQEVMEFFGFTTVCFKVEEGESHLLNQVLLDNQAQASIFGNPKFLEKLKDREVPHRYNGMGGGSVRQGLFAASRGLTIHPMRMSTSYRGRRWLKLEQK